VWRLSGVTTTMSEYIERDAFLESRRHLYCDNCARRKNGKGKFVYEIGDAPCRACDISDVLDAVEDFPAADVRSVPEGGIGEMSDGYHTFNGLYYQRMVLFAALVNAYKDKAWKSWRHEGGELCFGGGWFIVGIDTPEGSYTYHYEAKDFDLFNCEELPVAKHWDGHTEKDVTRLLSLDVRPVVKARWKPVMCAGNPNIQDRDELYGELFVCEKCNRTMIGKRNFCPNCGARMEES
jgi:hypothetical protein